MRSEPTASETAADAALPAPADVWHISVNGHGAFSITDSSGRLICGRAELWHKNDAEQLLSYYHGRIIARLPELLAFVEAKAGAGDRAAQYLQHTLPFKPEAA